MNRQESQWWSAGYTAEWWKGLDENQRRIFLSSLDDFELEDFAKDWRVWARDKQITPAGMWDTWLLVCGRGFGKTRSGVEFVRDEVENNGVKRIAIVGQGESDIRQVMIDGESGFLSCCPSWNMPTFYPSVGSGQLIWPGGAVGYLYSAEDPEALRGPQFELAWFDEPMAVPAEKRAKTVANLRMGLRLGPHPRLIYTTTPKPHRWLRELLAKEGLSDRKGRVRMVVTRGSTYENEDNLSGIFLDAIRDDYEGTSLGRQELHAEMLGDEEGALWTPELLDKQRMKCPETDDGSWTTQLLQAFARTCDRVVVSVDPSITASKTSHEAGITVIARRGLQRFLIADYSMKGTPLQWGHQAVKAYVDFDADEMVGEVNQGGDLVKANIMQAAATYPNEQGTLGVDIKFHSVRATKGKQRRAEPVATSYEQGKCFHLGLVGTKDKPGPFYNIEVQMCAIHDAYDPTGEDFDRADALVWGMTRLGGKKALSASSGGVAIRTFGDFQQQ